jgi:hypothetical protein
MMMMLGQPWATQIGSRSKFMPKCHVEGQNRDFFYRFCSFFYEIGIFQRHRLPMAVLGVSDLSSVRLPNYILPHGIVLFIGFCFKTCRLSAERYPSLVVGYFCCPNAQQLARLGWDGRRWHPKGRYPMQSRSNQYIIQIILPDHPDETRAGEIDRRREDLDVVLVPWVRLPQPTARLVDCGMFIFLSSFCRLHISEGGEPRFVANEV